jgi:predicted phosphoribosyltransferase
VYFRNRTEAGQTLAGHLQHYKNTPNVLVLALPRGGVPVAYEVARELNAALDVFTVRKLGVPGHQELAMGAIATGGVRILHDGVIQELGIPQRTIDIVSDQEQQELERRERIYRGERSAPVIENRTIIVVDDGLATGSSMRAAVRALRQKDPARLVVAVPTAPAEACQQLRESADEVVCVITPDPFYAVGGSYVDFGQITDDEVKEVIERAGKLSSGVRG